MSLESLIQSGGYQSAQEAYTAIVTPSVEVKDAQLYTWAGVADIIGPEAAEGLRIKFDTSGFGWVSLQLGGLGISLSDSRVQQVLLGFAQIGVAGCATLAAKGISLKAPWEVANLPGAPTQQEVQTAWQAVQLANAARERLRIIQETRQKWDQVSQQVRVQIESGIITANQVTTAVQQLWS